MYRWRFFILMIRALCSKQHLLSEDFHLNFRALPLIDTDMTRVFTQAYAAYMGLGRWHLVFNSELRKIALTHKWVPVTTSETITYRKSIKVFQKIRLTTKLVCWNENYFYLQQTFHVRGREVACTYVEGVMRGPDGIKRPKDVFLAANYTKASPPPPKKLNIWISSLRAQ